MPSLLRDPTPFPISPIYTGNFPSSTHMAILALNDTMLRFSDVFRGYRKRSVALNGLIFYSFAGTNGCFKSKCDFICLPVGEKNYTCECPDNLHKRGDTCKCPTGETLVNGECGPCKNNDKINTS